MKALMIGLALLVGGSGFALADQPGSDWMSVPAAIARLQALGYSNIMKIKADDGQYEGKAVMNGRLHEFRLDPHTGMITKDEVDEDQAGPGWMSIPEAVARLRGLGYSSISKIKADDGHYEGKGIKDGQVYEFHLNPHTGALTKEEADED